MPIRLEPLPASDLAPVGHLTFPAVLRIAQERYPSITRALAVRTDDEPAGLAVSVPGPDGQFELLSLYIAPFFRRMGLGTVLLDAVEAGFRDQGFRLGVHFLNVPAEDQASARFFMSAGWSKPAVNKLICRSTVPLALQTPWLVEATLPAHYAIVDWRTLSPTHRTALAAAADSGITADTDPFLHEAGCDAATSIALLDRDDGSVCGWVVTHRLDDGTLRWTCSFLKPALQTSGLMRALWLEVVRRQSADPRLVDFIFGVPLTEPRMAKFALRRMRPWLSGLAYGCTTMKKVA